MPSDLTTTDHTELVAQCEALLQRYASQKIIDLLLGPLGDRGRAMTELRMLIDRHPASREAEGAREALRNLKAE